MMTPGDRRVFKADGHDESASTIQRARRAAGKVTAGRWLTPSGRIVKEGRWYVKEWRMAFRVARISPRGVETLAYRGGWQVVSEGFETEEEATLWISLSFSPEITR